MCIGIRGWLVLAAAGMLGACSGTAVRPPSGSLHQGEASYHALPDDQMAHYELAMGSTSSGAVPIDHPSPAYPNAMLASCPARIQLKALLIVGADGAVDEVRFDDEISNASAFVDAVRAAALAWRFEPLIISHWAANANDEMHSVDTQAKPFSLPYEFRFACHDGRAQVSSDSDIQH